MSSRILQPVERTQRVLIIEGKVPCASGALLGRTGISCVRAADASTALQSFYREQPDAIVLDLDVSRRNGWEVLAVIREMSDVPVLLISSLRGSEEMVKGLNSGADDCMAQPVDEEELLARVEGLLRRSVGQNEPSLVIADEFVHIDQVGHTTKVLDVDVELTPTEFRLLAAFVQHPGQALTHPQLLEMVWSDGYRACEEVKLYVCYLRRKLKDAASLDPVETVRGVGYRYNPRHVE